MPETPRKYGGRDMVKEGQTITINITSIDIYYDPEYRTKIISVGYIIEGYGIRNMIEVEIW